jgi:hypothetical protein
MLAKRTVDVPAIGKIEVRRKKRMKYIRLRVSHEGRVILSIPRWILLKQALDFAETKKDWILGQKQAAAAELKTGMVLSNGRLLTVRAANNSRPSSKTTSSEIHVCLPRNYSKAQAQKYVKKKIDQTLKTEAEQTLIPRLQLLAKKHSVKYNSATVAILRSRWGSCDSQSNIKLNAYLLQLPGELVDYVILHELNHVKHMHHGRNFWSELRKMCTATDELRKKIKSYKPGLAARVP